MLKDKIVLTENVIKTREKSTEIEILVFDIFIYTAIFWFLIHRIEKIYFGLASLIQHWRNEKLGQELDRFCVSLSFFSPHRTILPVLDEKRNDLTKLGLLHVHVGLSILFFLFGTQTTMIRNIPTRWLCSVSVFKFHNNKKTVFFYSQFAWTSKTRTLCKR